MVVPNLLDISINLRFKGKAWAYEGNCISRYRFFTQFEINSFMGISKLTCQLYIRHWHDFIFITSPPYIVYLFPLFSYCYKSLSESKLKFCWWKMLSDSIFLDNFLFTCSEHCFSYSYKINIMKVLYNSRHKYRAYRDKQLYF